MDDHTNEEIDDNDDLRELESEFAELEDWDERYEFLIDLGRHLPEFPAEFHTDAHKVSGCMSQVWIVTSETGDSPQRLNIQADSDSIIVKGLIAILLTAFNNRPVEEIVGRDIEAVFRRIGLDQNISPNRRNGLFSMVKRIHEAAKKAV